MVIFIDPAKAHWVPVENIELTRLRNSERRLAELQEAVRWLLEVHGVVNDNIMCPQWRRHVGLSDIERAARAAVDALVGGSENGHS